MPLLEALLILTLSWSFYVPPGRAADCTLNNWNWSSNSLGQNPCTIVEQLEGACWNLVYILDPLTPGTSYVTPQKDSNPPCECNTVMYSLYSACTACQNASALLWTFYDQYCTEVYVTQYPVNIPSSTRIPHWAYLDVTTKGVWNELDSVAVSDQPESVPPSPSTISIPRSSTSSSSGSSSSLSVSSTETPESTTSPSLPSDTGAIVGGVVGSLVVLVSIGGIIAYLLYRRRQAAVIETSRNAPFSTRLLSDPLLSQPLKPYDPSDPSTFPAPMGENPRYGGNSLTNSNEYPSSYRRIAAPLGRGYPGPGVAEV